ncbi:MAG: LytTR family transcriptional regulator DNA-binding domain-containing protein [Bacteroidota bacterium]
MKAYLVDDESLARERLRSLLSHAETNLEIVGESGTATEAIEEINQLKPDVVFLDIEMPGLDGFDVVSLIDNPKPYIIFVTAYDQYAIKAFEVYALDYLTKPVRLERLNESLARLSQLTTTIKQHQSAAFEQAIQEKQKQPLEVLTAKRGTRIFVLDLSDILYIEAKEKLVYAHTEAQSYRLDHTLDKLEERLPNDHFIRSHRSYLVNVRFIKELIPWFSGTYEVKLSNGTQLSVSRRRVKEVKNRIGLAM